MVILGEDTSHSGGSPGVAGSVADCGGSIADFIMGVTYATSYFVWKFCQSVMKLQELGGNKPNSPAPLSALPFNVSPVT